MLSAYYGHGSIAKLLVARLRWIMVAKAVRALPYVLHWQRVYSEAVFHPDSVAAQCAAYVTAGDKRSIAQLQGEEDIRQLKRLVKQLGATSEQVALTRAISQYRTTGE